MLIRALFCLLLSLGVAFAQQVRNSPFLGQVATRSNIPTTFVSGSAQMQTRTTHFARSTINSLQLVIPNWYVNVLAVNEETATGGTATVAASVEYPAGTFTQVTFGGSSTGSIASGSTITSDSTSVAIPNGSTFYVRIWYSNPAGLPEITYSANGMMAGDGFVSGTTTPNLTLSGSVTQATTTGFFPAAIIAQTANPVVCVWGASRFQGILDTANANGDLGEIARSVGGYYAYINMSVSGDQIGKVLSSHALRLPLVNYCTTVVTGDAALNDLVAGSTPAQVAGYLTQFIALIPGQVPVWISTLAPVSTSTDGWTSLSNQTPASSNAKRIAFNTNVRSCGSGTIVGMRGCIDIASITESSFNSGLWTVLAGGIAITSEGTHEIQVGEILIKRSNIVPYLTFGK